MISIESIKEHWEVRYRDIDPDTGNTVNDKPVCISLDKQSAGGIVNALNLVDEEPNRRYYMYVVNAIPPSDVKFDKTL